MSCHVHLTQTIVLQQVVHHEFVPDSDHNMIWIPIKGPHGLCLNHFLGLPNKGRCCLKRKKNHPLAGNNVGSGDPKSLTLPLPCGAKGLHGELGFGVLSADPAGVVGKGLGEPTICLPLPLAKSHPYLLDTNHEGVVGLVLPPPTPHFLHLLPFLLRVLLFLLTLIEGRLPPRNLLGMGGDGLHYRLEILRMLLDQKSNNPSIYLYQLKDVVAEN